MGKWDIFCVQSAVANDTPWENQTWTHNYSIHLNSSKCQRSAGPNAISNLESEMYIFAKLGETSKIPVSLTICE